jgi:hypothetical protein
VVSGRGSWKDDLHYTTNEAERKKRERKERKERKREKRKRATYLRTAGTVW